MNNSVYSVYNGKGIVYHCKDMFLINMFHMYMSCNQILAPVGQSTFTMFAWEIHKEGFKFAGEIHSETQICSENT